jgi:CelD/BcsL family acetyltransferase involved in cellulose biosynthesis
MASSRRVQILSVTDALADARVRRLWDSALDPRVHSASLFQSPEWVAHAARFPKEGPAAIACLRDSGGVPLALAAYEQVAAPLSFDAGGLVLHKAPLTTANLLGGKPIAAMDAALVDELLTGMFDAVPALDCIRLETVKKHGEVWQLVDACARVHERALAYVPKSYAVGGKLHEIALPESFERYLADQFSSKHRGNLKRTIKALREASSGTLRLSRFDQPGDGGRFFDAAAPVATASWQAQQGTEFSTSPDLRARLDDLADRGLLRCYLLHLGDAPCAFVIGYQWQSEFHYIRIAYDPKFAKLSPGTALLYLLLEELCAEKRVSLVSLGAGDFGYKAQFGNIHVDVGDVLLLRRTVRNRLLRATHSGFRDAVVLVRDWLRARKGAGSAGRAKPAAAKPAA